MRAVPPSSPAAHVTSRLNEFLGPHTARNAMKTFSMKALGRAPETLTLADMPVLLQALRPMLRTLLGEESADHLLESIQKELA
jgi:hypothetical protein